jgi:hypothetical protein
LFGHYGTRLPTTAVVDLQLLELASVEKARDRKKVKGLPLALQSRLRLPREQWKDWQETKDVGHMILTYGPDWQPEKARQNHKDILLSTKTFGDTDEQRAQAALELDVIVKAEEARGAVEKINVFKELPLRAEMTKYALGDVVVLPLLYDHLHAHERLTDSKKKAVEEETNNRITESQAEEEMVTGADAPEGWAVTERCEEDKEKKEMDRMEGLGSIGGTGRTIAENMWYT